MNQLKVLIITAIIGVSSVAQAQFFKANVLGTVNFAQVDGDHIGGYNKFGLNPGIGIYHEMDDSQRENVFMHMDMPGWSRTSGLSFNAFNWEFMQSAGSVLTPGYTPFDAKDVKKVEFQTNQGES